MAKWPFLVHFGEVRQEIRAGRSGVKEKVRRGSLEIGQVAALSLLRRWLEIHSKRRAGAKEKVRRGSVEIGQVDAFSPLW